MTEQQNKKREALKWLLKHMKSQELKEEAKNIARHPNLQAIVDNNFDAVYDDGRMARFERETPGKKGHYDFLIYDITLHKYEVAYMDGHFHHGDVIKKYLPLKKRQNIGYI